jgi:hypothetical protein
MSNEKYPSKCYAAYPTSSQCEFINLYYPLFFIMYYMHTDSLTPYLTHLEQTQSTSSRTPTQATRTNPVPPPPLATTNPVPPPPLATTNSVPPPPRRRKTQRVAAIFGKSKLGPTIPIDLTEGDSDERGGSAIRGGHAIRGGSAGTSGTAANPASKSKGKRVVATVEKAIEIAEAKRKRMRPEWKR